MPSRTKSVLLMSQEKFLSGRGSGFSNTDSDGNTGSPTSSGQKKVPVLFLPWEPLQTLPSDDILKEELPHWKDELEPPVSLPSGSPTEIVTEPLTYSAMAQDTPLSLWKTLFQPTK